MRISTVANKVEIAFVVLIIDLPNNLSECQVNLFTGKDVVILQNLLLRSIFVKSELETTGIYDKKTSEAVASYQEGNGLPYR